MLDEYTVHRLDEHLPAKLKPPPLRTSFPTWKFSTCTHWTDRRGPRSRITPLPPPRRPPATHLPPGTSPVSPTFPARLSHLTLGEILWAADTQSEVRKHLWGTEGRTEARPGWKRASRARMLARGQLPPSSSAGVSQVSFRHVGWGFQGEVQYRGEGRGYFPF